MPRAKYRMVTVVERFRDPKNGVPRERLSCGHVKTDRILWDENVKWFMIKRAFEVLSPETPVKARCYKCGNNVPLAPTPLTPAKVDPMPPAVAKG